MKKELTKEKGFTLVELMVVLAVVGALAAVGGFSLRYLLSTTRAEQVMGQIFGMFTSARAKAMGQSRIYLVEVRRDRVTVYMETIPGSYDVISMGQALSAGSVNLADFTEEERFNFGVKGIELSSVSILKGVASTPLAVPLFLAMLPNGRVMVNNMDPLSIQRIQFEFVETSPPGRKHYILIFPYTGRILLR